MAADLDKHCAFVLRYRDRPGLRDAVGLVCVTRSVADMMRQSLIGLGPNTFKLQVGRLGGAAGPSEKSLFRSLLGRPGTLWVSPQQAAELVGVEGEALHTSPT